MDNSNKPSGSKPPTTTDKKTKKKQTPLVRPETTVVQTFPGRDDLEPLTRLNDPRTQYPGVDAAPTGNNGDKILSKNLAAINAHRCRISVSYKTAYSATDERKLEYEPLGGVYIEGPHCKTSLPAASRRERKANIFSSDALREFIIPRLLSGTLTLLPISTKGGSQRDTIMCLVSTSRKGRAEVPIGAKSLAMKEYVAWYNTLTAKEKDGVVPPDKKDSLKVQLSHLIWRYTHREMIDGEFVCRQIPCIGEVSHMAERYHYCEALLDWPEIDHNLLNSNGYLTRVSSMTQYSPPPGSFTPFKDKAGWYYHRVNMESHVWNEFRKDCARFGLAVRKASTREFYAPGEESDEPSMCPHEQMGCPCFMPPHRGSPVQTFIPSHNDASTTPDGGLSFKKRRVSVQRDHRDVPLGTPGAIPPASTFPGLSTLLNHASLPPPSLPHNAGPAELPGIITYSPSRTTVEHPHAHSSIDQKLSPDLRVAIADIEDMFPPPDDCRQPLNLPPIDDDDD